MEYARALDLAHELVCDLRSECEQIAIAGSVRREKAEVKDLELVAIPKFELVPILDMFGQQMGVDRVNLLEERLDALLEPCTWPWAFDAMLRRNGPHYKRLWNEEARIACDLFLTTERGWGGAMAIRTGPADFSQALVTLALRRRMHVADGCLLHGHPKDDGCTKGELCPLIVPTLTEEAFFQALGLKWVDPRSRTAEAIWRDERRRVTA